MLVALVLLSVCLLSCGFALWKGGSAERLGAVVIILNLITATANYRLTQNELIDLGIDGITAAVLLVVTLRYASIWLGAVMLIFAMQFGLDAYYLVLERSRDTLHQLINNADSVAISLSLAIGTALSLARRGAVRGETAELATNGA